MTPGQAQAVSGEAVHMIESLQSLQTHRAELAQVRDERRRIEAARQLAEADEAPAVTPRQRAAVPTPADTPTQVTLADAPVDSPDRSQTVPAEPDQDPNLTCAICQDEYSVGDMVITADCGHRFHSQCLDLWIATELSHHRTPRCPYCRHDQVTGTDAYAFGPPEQGRIEADVQDHPMTDPARAPADVPVQQGFEGLPEELRAPFGPAYSSAGGSSSSSIGQRSSHSFGHRSVRSAMFPWGARSRRACWPLADGCSVSSDDAATRWQAVSDHRFRRLDQPHG